MLEIKEFRCYEAKIEESEKAGSHRESNPGHLSLERHIEDCGVGGCPVAQWRSLVARARCSGFDSRQLPAFSLSSIFAS